MERSLWTRRSLEWGILLLSLGYIGLHVMPRAWHALVTDFPNYYMAARLAREHYDTSRMYEWIWLQRQKDLHAIAIRVIGLSPITPFSTLFFWPLTVFSPLAAKRVWIVLNLALLFPTAWLLHRMSGLSYLRIALAFALSVPLARNLEFGQFYVLLLLLITAACWAYLRGWRASAGMIIAIAAASKIFPVIFLIFFLRRRDWRALAAFAITTTAAILCSITVFGWTVHRTYALQILPWALHGEAMPPYVPNASISSILHRLFLSEPQWNPHPWHPSPPLYALLLPTLQVLLLAPTALLIRTRDSSPSRTLMEWSALLIASLTISTDPASYNFVLMAMPLCVLSAILLERNRRGSAFALWIAYLGIGFPFAAPESNTVFAILLSTPRLLLMIGLLIGANWMLWKEQEPAAHTPDRSRYVWMAAFATGLLVTAHATLLRERAVRSEFRFRLPLAGQGYLNAAPQLSSGRVHFIAFTLDGYHLLPAQSAAEARSEEDDLSFTMGSGRTLVERTSGSRLEIIDLQMQLLAEGARDPMLSADGRSVAIIRESRGEGRLMLIAKPASASRQEHSLTPASQNVYEGSYLSADHYAFSATEGSGEPRIFLKDATHASAPLPLGEARYPALSPDGKWLAFSRQSQGVWNLWVRNQQNGEVRRVANVPCNQIQPSWEPDSKTLLYASDCGRSLWFTAIARRQVVP
jgi:hypothetical protein